jgi:hypothetical protein
MTSTANQAFEAQPNVLRGQTVPNTMGGLGVPAVSARLGLSSRALLAAASAILAGSALALVLGRGA